MVGVELKEKWVWWLVGGTTSGYSGLEGNVQGASEHAGEQGKGKHKTSLVASGTEAHHWFVHFYRSNEEASGEPTSIVKVLTGSPCFLFLLYSYKLPTEARCLIHFSFFVRRLF